MSPPSPLTHRTMQRCIEVENRTFKISPKILGLDPNFRWGAFSIVSIVYILKYTKIRSKNQKYDFEDSIYKILDFN